MSNKFHRFAICLLAMLLVSMGCAAASKKSFVLNLPANLDIIDAEAFESADALEKVVVPEGTTEIRSRAFAYSSLVEINLPSTIQYIAEDAFEGCEGLVIMAKEGTYAYNWCADHGFITEGPAIISLNCSHEDTAEIGDTITWAVRTAGGTGAISYHFDVYCDDALTYTQDTQMKNYISLSFEDTGNYYIEAFCYDETEALSSIETDSITIVEPQAQISDIVGPVGVIAEGETLAWNVTAEGGSGLLQYSYEVMLNGNSILIEGYSNQNQYSFVTEHSGEYMLIVKCKDGIGRVTTAHSTKINVYSMEEVYPAAPELVFLEGSSGFALEEMNAPEYAPQIFDLSWKAVKNANDYGVRLYKQYNNEWIDVLNEDAIQTCGYRLNAAFFNALTEKTIFRLELTAQGLRTSEIAAYYFAIIPVIADTSITVDGMTDTAWNQNARFASSRTFTIASELEWTVESITEVKIWSDDNYGTDWITYSINDNQLKIMLEEATEERKALITLGNGINTAQISIWQCIAEEAPIITYPFLFSTDINNPSEYPVGEFDLRWNENNNERTRLRISEIMEDGSLRRIYDKVTSYNREFLREPYLQEALKANTTYAVELAGVCSSSYKEYEIEDDVFKTVYYVRITDEGQTIKVNNKDSITFSNILSQTCFVTASNYFGCSTDAEWLTISDTYITKQSDYITIKAALNDTGISRTGHVYFTCGEATAIATVIQDDMSLQILYPEGISKDASNPTKLYMDLNLLDTNYFHFIYQGEDLYLERYKDGAYGEMTRIANRSDYKIHEAEIETSDVAGASHCRLTVTYKEYSAQYYVGFRDADDTYYDAFYNSYLFREEDAHRHTITLYSDAVTDWTVSSNVPWLIPSVKSGSGNKEFTVTIAENTTGFPRTGRLTFRSTENNGIKWQDIKQFGESYMAVYCNNSDANRYELYDPNIHCTQIYDGKGDTTDYFSVYATNDIYVNSNVDWICSTVECPDSGGRFKLEIEKNPSVNGVRTGTVTITNGVNRQDISITQAPSLSGIEIAALNLSVNSSNPSVVPYEDIELTWNAVDNAIRYTIDGGVGSASFKIADISATNLSQYRCVFSCEHMEPFVKNHVKIKAYDQYGHYISKTFYFMPVSENAVLINGASSAVWEDASDINASNNYVIQSLTNWTAEADRSWITLSQTSGTAGDTLTVTLAENTSNSSRRGTVTVMANNAEAVLTINQCAYLAEEYPSLAAPIFSMDKSDPTIITLTDNTLTFNWDREPQANYYELTILRQKSENVSSIIADSPRLDEDESSYTFKDLELSKGELYSVQLIRCSDRWKRSAQKYYFMISDENAWVFVDEEVNASMEAYGNEDAESFKITSNGYWVAHTEDDWIMLYKGSISQDDLDANKKTTANYDQYSGVSGEWLWISVLANPDNTPRTGAVKVSNGKAEAIITVHQYQSYSIASLTSPNMSTDSKDAAELPYDSITFQWNSGYGGTGRYALRLEYKDPKWGWEEIINESGLISRSCKVSTNSLVEGCDYRLWLGTEIAQDEYSGKRYYFYLQYEDELTPVLTVDWSQAMIGGRVNVFGGATGGAGDYSISYELYRDGERVDMTTWGATDSYFFPITKAGEYQIQLYVKDATNRQKNISSEIYTVGANSPASYLNISQTAWAITAAGDSTDIIVDSSDSWTAVASDNWITVSASGSQANIAVAQNTSATARSGQVAFRSGSNTALLTITQRGMEAVEEAAIMLSQSVWNLLNPSADMLNLSIETDSDWTVSNQPDWLSLSQTSGTGSAVLSIYAGYNNGGTRSAELTFAIDGITKKLYVTQVGADVVAQVLNVEVSDNEPLTGEEVVFTIETRNADELLYMVDGQLIDTINVIQNTVTYRWTYSLAKDEGREVYFIPRRDGIQGLISEPILMNVVSYGDLASPILGEVDKVNIGDSAFISWSAVPNADHYAVYLYSNGATVFKETAIKDLQLKIESENLPSVGTYTLLVMASATGYNQSESADILRVVMPEETFELIEPKSNYAFDVGNRIDIEISNPDGYMLQARIKKDGNVVALFPESGPAADLNPVYSFIPVEGGVHEFSILAFNTAGDCQWNDGVTLASIDVEGPAFKETSYIGTGARGMFVEQAASFKIVTNTAVTKVVVNDGVRDYIAENPVLNTSGGWTYTFSGTMAEQTPGKHVYSVTAYDAYEHSVSRTFKLYAAERVTEHTLYPQASSVVVFSAPDQTKEAAKLYPSDSVKVIGQCMDYWYVNFDGIKGFVEKNKLGSTKLTAWEGLNLNWKSLSSESIISYVGDNASFNLNWDCSISIPASAEFRVILFGQTGTEMGTRKTVYTGRKMSATIETKDLLAENYQAILQVVSADGTIIYMEQNSLYNIVLFGDYSNYMNYMIKQDDNYDDRLNSVIRWGNRLLGVHEGLVTTEYDGKTVEDTLPTQNVLTHSVMDTYAVLSPNATAFDSGALRVTYIVENILYNMSSGSDNRISLNDFEYFAELIGFTKDGYEFIYETLLEMAKDEIGDAIAMTLKNRKIVFKADLIGKLDKLNKPIEVFDGISDVIDIYDQLCMLENFIGRYNRYSKINRADLKTVIAALKNSGDRDLVNAANILNYCISTEDSMLNYLARVYLGDVTIKLATGSFRDLLLEFVPPAIGNVIKIGTGLADFSFRVNALTECSYHAQWSIDAAKAYYPEYAKQLEEFRNNPCSEYSDFVIATATFGSLVETEWRAMEDLTNEHAKNMWVFICNGFELKGWEGDTPEKIVLDTLRNAIDDFYNDYISQFGIPRQKWPNQ